MFSAGPFCLSAWPGFLEQPKTLYRNTLLIR
jgi:hypothetical protein